VGGGTGVDRLQGREKNPLLEKKKGKASSPPRKVAQPPNLLFKEGEGKKIHSRAFIQGEEKKKGAPNFCSEKSGLRILRAIRSKELRKRKRRKKETITIPPLRKGKLTRLGEKKNSWQEGKKKKRFVFQFPRGGTAESCIRPKKGKKQSTILSGKRRGNLLKNEKERL